MTPESNIQSWPCPHCGSQSSVKLLSSSEKDRLRGLFEGWSIASPDELRTMTLFACVECGWFDHLSSTGPGSYAMRKELRKEIASSLED